mgnify:CR=1 FL=1
MKLYGLYKNGQLAKISQDSDALFSTFLKLKDSGHQFDIKELKNNLTVPKIPRSNVSLGLRGDGGPRLTQSTSDAIGNALERCEDPMVNWNDDSEFKSRKTIDKINNME